MKILLAGSSPIVLSTFKKIIEYFNVVGIITQPNKPKGRGLKIQTTSVAQLAQENKIPLYAPWKINTLYPELKKIEFDFFLTFSFGQYVPLSILNLAKYKSVNIHGSLLPKYRGAAPIHHAILEGDSEIGISLIEMEKEMDAGNIFFQEGQKINQQTTTGEAFKIVANLAKTNIVDWLNKMQKNNFYSKKQGLNFSYAPKIQKKDAELKTNLSIYQAVRKIRGYNPWPGAFLFLNSKRLKIFDYSIKPVNMAPKLKFQDGFLWATIYQWEGKPIIILKN